MVFRLVSSFFYADGRCLRVTGIKDGIIRHSKYSSRYALRQRLAVAAGVLPVSYAALEDRVAHEGDAVFFAVIDHGVRSVAWRP